jgi:uncharacterized protein YjbI with pentapeptide repeats
VTEELGLSRRLTATEQDFVGKAREGSFFDPGGKAPRPSESSGWAERVVDADVVAALLTAPGARVHRLGVRLRGVHISGTLDLRAAKLLAPLDLWGCRLTCGPKLDDAHGSSIAVRDCHLGRGGLDAARLDLDGTLDLSGTKFQGRVSLHDARIGADLVCSRTQFCRGRRAVALYAPGVTVEASVLLDKSTAGGCVDLSQATIERSVDCRCVEYTCSNGPALRLRGSRVGADVDCRGAKVSSKRSAIDADHLTAGNVLLSPDADGTEGGERPSFADVAGCVSFAGAKLDSLRVDGAHLQGATTSQEDATLVALDLTGARIEGEVSLAPAEGRRCELSGSVRLSGAEIGGDLDFTAAKIHSEGDVAIDATGITVATVRMGTALLRGNPHRFRARGEVRFSNATMDELNCRGARLIGTGSDPTALRATAATVKRKVLLDRDLGENGEAVYVDNKPLRFHATGVVDLQDASAGQVLCRGARFHNPGGHALILYGAQITEQLLLEAAVRGDRGALFDTPGGNKMLRMQANGTVLLQNASIGHLSLRGARLRALGKLRALDARNVEVRGDALLDTAKDGDSVEIVDADGPVAFDARGEVSFAGGTIAGTLNLEKAHLTALEAEEGNPKRPIAFDASTATITRKFVWCCVKWSGVVDLRGLHAGSLEDTMTGWKGAEGSVLMLDGFHYSALMGDDTAKWKTRRDEWLKKTAYATQPYQQLSEVYRSIGYTYAARKIAMARFNARLSWTYTKAHPPNRPGRALRLAGRWVLRLLIGHGYEPWRALIPVLVLFVVAFAVTKDAVSDGEMVRVRALTVDNAAQAPTTTGKKTPLKEAEPTDCRRKDYPCLQPVLYAADLLVPVVNLGQRDAWRATGGSKWLPPLMTVLGWVLTTLIVAGFTGLVRRE